MNGTRRSLLVLVLAAALAACTDEGPRRSLLIVTMDTTRADALSLYGTNPTPALARLGAEGVVFDHAYTAIPITLPSHSTLFTGLYPLRHGVRDNGRNPLSGEAHTLAEVAHEAGYQTAAFLGAMVLDPTFGLDQGFERYDVPAPTPGAKPASVDGAERPAREVVDGALAWLAARDRSRPWLLWVHVFDAHSPYAPPPGFEGTTSRARYDGEVRSADHELARLFDALRVDGTLDSTLVIVAGDHGEGFGEHGELGHSVHCYESTLHVPLVVRAPFWERLAPGSRSQELVGLVDLVPTVCDALGLDPPGALDGQSFWNTAVASTRGLYFESYYGYLNFGWSPLAGWIDEHGKYVHASEPRYFDPRADPGEERDLSGARAADVKRAQVAIARLAEEPKLAAGASRATEEDLAALRGLGYVAIGGGATGLPHPLADTGMPAPEAMGASYERALQALELGNRGELAEAERILREVLAENPENPFLLDHLAALLVQRGALPEAEEVLRRLLAIEHAVTPGAWFRLGHCLEGQGRVDEAIEALRAGLVLDPARASQREDLVRLLRSRGREPEAAEAERAAPRPP